jgi:hypothetical protein
MIKTTTTAAVLMALLFGGAVRASAQTTAGGDKYFVNFNIGAQTGSHDVNASSSVPLYGEVATFTTAQQLGSGAVIDVSGGYRITRQFAVAIGFSHFANTENATVVASIPNPFVVNRPAQINIDESGLKHSEVGTHLMAVYFMPVTVNFDVTVSGGPSFTHVSQDIPTGTVAAGTQTPTISVGSESGTAVGVNLGVAGNYLFSPRYGVAGFLRFVSGSVDLPDAPDVKAGGFQVGVGATFRF